MSDFTPQSPRRRASLRSGDVRSPRRGRDPFVARVGAIVLIGLLGIPVVAALSGDGGGVENQSTGGAAALMTPNDGDGSIALIDPTATTTTLAPPPTAATTAPATETAAATQAPATQAAATEAPATQAPATTAPATTAAATTAAEQQRAEVLSATAATTASTATTEPACSGEYEVGAGDYWIGIADRAGVTTRELLAANDATSKTPIYPGSSICLPAGAQDPGPPPAPTTTQAPTTTAAPSTTAKPSSTTTNPPTTTAKPATTSTTAAPTTTQPRRTYSRDEVTAIIASVFPADMLETALKIAERESSLQPGVRNYCCFGLFQIHWEAHRSWLAGMGITSAEQLYDPLVNAKAAWALYQRAGGWGPWGGVPG